LERLDKHRGQVQTRSGPASYIDTGGPGRPALLVHGVGTSSYLWRHVISQLEGERRCVAVDLPLHGYTPDIFFRPKWAYWLREPSRARPR
jgi:pimeloyl-ACP methyl ester carboxylesterase